MKRQVQRLHAAAERLVVLMAGIGAAIIAVQMVWISYGVVMRYVFRSPDRLATEATALLLFPVAFVGLGYALKEGALPRVTILLDLLPARLRRGVDLMNLAIMVAVGGFFATAAVRATGSSYASGAASEVLSWPKFIFWAPAALALVIFTVYAALKVVLLASEPVEEEATDGVV